MKTVIVDKVASDAQHSDIGGELRLSKDIPCEEGTHLGGAYHTAVVSSVPLAKGCSFLWSLFHKYLHIFVSVNEWRVHPLPTGPL